MAKVCPYCGSTKFIKAGTQENSSDGSIVQRYKCKRVGCFKHFIHPRWTGIKSPKQPLDGDTEVVETEGNE